LSSIRRADRIAVIADGKLKEIGRYDDLMAKPKGHFRRLQAIQFGEEDAKSTKTKDKKKKKKMGAKSSSDDEEIDDVEKEKEKMNAQRARLLAQQDAFYFTIGGIGALLAGVVFPAWGCKLKLICSFVFGCFLDVYFLIFCRR
jgi:ABC-type proline/glycine betaine transport system ATPase subunit